MSAKVVAVVAFVGLSAVSSTALASIIQINFSGNITVSDFSSVPVNSTFAGTAYYDTAAALLSTDPNPCIPTSPCNGHYAFPLEFFVTVNGSSAGSLNIMGDNLQVEDSPPSSSFPDTVTWIAGFYPLALSGPLASERSAFDNLSVYFDGPNSVLSSTQLGGTFPGLNAWTTLATVDFSTSTALGPADKSFHGVITNLTSSATTPEPGAFVLCATGLSVLAFWRRHSLRSA
jgi:hypothetical protein